jgi:site-specific recombinase XerD
MNSFPVSVCIEGFLLQANARRLSPNTITWYKVIFKKLTAYFSADPPIASITRPELEQYLGSLTTISKKSLVGYHACLSALWRWSVSEGFAEKNIVREIPKSASSTPSPRPKSNSSWAPSTRARPTRDLVSAPAPTPSRWPPATA